jgi:ribonucleoside-diphosphate reductase alpha chain
MFVDNDKFDHDSLYAVTKRVTRNLNKVIDRNYYPVKGPNSNMRHRPIGLGVQGLADAFIMLRLPLHLMLLKTESRNFRNTILCSRNRFYGIGQRSPYSSFEGSPMSQGEFQYNLWGMKDEELSGWDWASLEKK